MPRLTLFPLLLVAIASLPAVLAFERGAGLLAVPVWAHEDDDGDDGEEEGSGGEESDDSDETGGEGDEGPGGGDGDQGDDGEEEDEEENEEDGEDADEEDGKGKHGRRRGRGRESHRPTLFEFLGAGTAPQRRDDPDPRDAPAILALGLAPEDVDRLEARGFRLRESEHLSGLGLRVQRFSPPSALTPEAALAVVQDLLPGREFDLDRSYRLQGAVEAVPDSWPFELVAWKAMEQCVRNGVLGMIDTGVDKGHPALRRTRVEARRFSTSTPADPGHGTEIAALLVGRGGLLPGAPLLVADVFAGGPGGPQTGAFEIARGLDWLLRRGVRVVNLSLAGPDNLLLRRAVMGAVDRGLLLVAAAGNAGPSAPPAYPASYPGVLAVTAVDRGARVWPRAQRGPYVDFAAPGVALALLDGHGLPVRRSGTSYAAAFVSAAAALLAGSGIPNGAVETRLARAARDLGPRGRDPFYGWGLVRFPGTCG